MFSVFFLFLEYLLFLVYSVEFQCKSSSYRTQMKAFAVFFAISYIWNLNDLMVKSITCTNQVQWTWNSMKNVKLLFSQKLFKYFECIWWQHLFNSLLFYLFHKYLEVVIQIMFHFCWIKISLVWSDSNRLIFNSILSIHQKS